jgi:hypothetical protein
MRLNEIVLIFLWIKKDRQRLRSIGKRLRVFVPSRVRIVRLVKLSDSGEHVEESLNCRTIHSSPPNFGILISHFSANDFYWYFGQRLVLNRSLDDDAVGAIGR